MCVDVKSRVLISNGDLEMETVTRTVLDIKIESNLSE